MTLTLIEDKHYNGKLVCRFIKVNVRCSFLGKFLGKYRNYLWSSWSWKSERDYYLDFFTVGDSFYQHISIKRKE